MIDRKVPAALADQLTPTARLLLLLLVTALYLLLHPYQGLVHDARLYTLQALNHLHPELYGNDVFLSHGSQDSYTLFTPLYAAAISVLGAEPAASLLTALSVVALLYAGGSLARTLMPPALAWLALALFVLVPGFYGSGITFAVLEEFLTPRMLAEALVLLALTAWLRSRWRTCCALLLAGLLMHPLMTLPGVIVIAAAMGLTHWRTLWPVAALGLIACVVALFIPLPLGPWQLDEAWRPTAEWAPHLMLAKWSIHDWARAVTVGVTLAFAALALPDPARRLASAVLLAVGATLLLSWVGGDVLKLALVVQGQAWRSLWLATALAVLLLPATGFYCWTGTTLQRAAWLLLVAAWLVGAWSLSLLFCIPGAIAMIWGRRSLPERIGKVALAAAVTVLSVLVICIFSLAVMEQQARSADIDLSWLETTRASLGDNRLLGLLALLAWYSIARLRKLSVTAIAAAPLVLVVALLGIDAVRGLQRQQYPAATRLAFSSWRALIPVGADVLWATEAIPGSDPMTVWLVLERPSFYSSVQVNSGLFSRSAAMELSRRHRAIPPSLPTEAAISIRYHDSARRSLGCEDIPARFIVTDRPIRGAKVVEAPPLAGSPFAQLSLHICG